MSDKEQDLDTQNEDRPSGTEGDDSSVLRLRQREKVEPETSSTDDTSRLVTQSSNTVSAADAESSSSSSGIEAGSSRTDAAEGTISSSTDAEHEISSAGQKTVVSSLDTRDLSASSSFPEVTSTKHQISAAGQETAGSSPDTRTSPGASLDTGDLSASSSFPEVTSTKHQISAAGQETAGSSPDTGTSPGTSPGASLDADIQSESSSGVEIQPDSSPMDAGCEISSTGQETYESSPDTGTLSEMSSTPEVQSESSPDVAQPESSSADVVQSEPSSSSLEVKPESSLDDEQSELFTDTGVHSETSSTFEVQPGSSPTDSEHQIVSGEAQSESSSDDVVQSEPSSSCPEVKAESSPDGQSELSTDTGVHSESSSTFEVQIESSLTDAEHQIVSTEASPDTGVEAQLLTVSDVQPGTSRTVTADEIVLSSMDVEQKIPSTKKSSVSGVVIPPLTDNSLLRALLNKDRIPETDPAPPPHSDLPTEYTEADAEEMRAFAGNRYQRNVSSETRPFVSFETSRTPVVLRSTSFEEAASEVIVYPEEGDHVVPDVGGSWERTPFGSFIPYGHDETTSDSLVSEQYTASESYSPEAQSTEESAAEENQELCDTEAEFTDTNTLTATEPTVQSNPVVFTEPTVQSNPVVFTEPTVQSNPVVFSVPTVQELGVSIMTTEPDVATVPTADDSVVAIVPKISNPDATVPTVEAASISTMSTVEESSFATVPTLSNTATVTKVSNEADAVPTSFNEAETVSPIRGSVADPEDPCKVKANKRPMARSDDASSGSEESDFSSPAKKMAEDIQVAYASMSSVQAQTTSVPTDPATETDSEETPYRGKATKRRIDQPEAGSSDSEDPGFPSPTKKKMESPSNIPKTPEGEN